jgi:NAD(P)-dependent dehydrogenase (short-subunit alcohol dehydrogenase family)
MGRAGTVEEIAQAALFLASDESSKRMVSKKERSIN